MTAFHRLSSTTSPGGFVFECVEEACGRRLLVDPDRGLIVLDRGDIYALHSGSTGGVELQPARVSQQ
jgi:hypothetical protein